MSGDKLTDIMDAFELSFSRMLDERSWFYCEDELPCRITGFVWYGPGFHTVSTRKFAMKYPVKKLH